MTATENATAQPPKPIPLLAPRLEQDFGRGDDPAINPNKPTGIIVRVTDIQPGSITLRLEDQANTLPQGRYRPHAGVRLFRMGPDGVRRRLTQFGRISGFVNFTDTGLLPDTGYVYMADAFASRPTGEVVTRTSTAGCPASKVFTRPTEESRPVWRVQVELRTADRPGASTSDEFNVAVILNVAPKCQLFPVYPHRPVDGTWLNYGRNDFERGDVFRYDVNFDSLGDLADIHYLTIAQSNENDGWLFAGLSLFVNEIEVYRRDFGQPVQLKSSSVTQARADVTHEMLRSHPLWQRYQQPPTPTLIPKSFLQSKIESYAGGILGIRKEKDAAPLPCKLRMKGRWRDGIPRDGSGVHLSALDAERLHVKLDVETDVTLHGPAVICSDFVLDPCLSVKFDLRVGSQCVTADVFRVTVTAENPQPKASYCLVDLPPSIAQGIEGEIVHRILDIQRNIDLRTRLCATDCDPFVEVTQDAELRFGIRNPQCQLP
jgi:hypothetical protein